MTLVPVAVVQVGPFEFKDGGQFGFGGESQEPTSARQHLKQRWSTV